MTPAIYLIAVLLIAAGCVAVEAVRLYRRQRKLRALAHAWEMHFAPGDRLRLGSRIAAEAPIPGSAYVRVRDLFFRTRGNYHQYVFTVEYTVGVIRGKVGRRRVAGFQELIARGQEGHHAAAPVLTLAPRELGLAAAYEYVRDALAQASAAA